MTRELGVSSAARRGKAKSQWTSTSVRLAVDSITDGAARSSNDDRPLMDSIVHSTGLVDYGVPWSTAPDSWTT